MRALSLLSMLLLGLVACKPDASDDTQADDTQADDTQAGDDTSGGDSDDSASNMEHVCTEVTLNEGNSGTYTYTGGEDDQKHHWNMAEAQDEIIAQVDWTDLEWTVKLIVGKGECPDAGEAYASDSNQEGTVVVDTLASDVAELKDGLYLDGRQHFAHVAPPNTVGLSEGDSFDYTVSVQTCGWVPVEAR